MKTLLFALLLLTNIQDVLVERVEVETALTTVLNTQNITKFLDYYLNRRDILYFRFIQSAAYSSDTLKKLDSIKVNIKGTTPLIYNETQDETQRPVITVQILKMCPDTAQFRVGIPIEGAVGKFTLIKDKSDKWIIIENEVYEI